MCGAHDLRGNLVVLFAVMFNPNTILMAVDSGKQNLLDQQIFVETSLGDFIDKITILQIKKERIHDAAKLSNICKELDFLTECYNKSVLQTSELDNLTRQLTQVNKNLWDLEDEVRIHEREKTFDLDFINSVKSILENNDRRACIKRTINLLGGSRIIEEKSYNHIKELEIRGQLNCPVTLQQVSLSVATAIGELVDRITILELKLERIEDVAKKGNILHELDILNEILGHHISINDEFINLKKDLFGANAVMWDIQDAIRAQKSLGLFGAEFIRLGRSVYAANDKRVAIKRAINQLFGSQLVEEKMYASY